MRNTSVPCMQGHPSNWYSDDRYNFSNHIKIDVFCMLLKPKRKKHATVMAYMNMILIGTLKDNINYDIPSRNRFLIYYFVLFLLHQSLTWILKFMIFQLFWLMRANGNETEAKLLCRVQIGRWEDGSTVAANFQSIFGPSGGRNVAISSFVQKLLLFIYLLLQPYKKNHILPRWCLHLVDNLNPPPTIHMLYFMLSKLSKSENTIDELLNLKKPFLSLSRFKFLCMC